MSDDSVSTQRRSPINWPDRISKLEICQGDMKERLFLMNEQMQQAMLRNAEANERIASHLEETRRVWDRVDEIERTIRDLEKMLIEIREQHKQLLDFSAGVRKVAWVAVTCGGVVLWWIVQRWVESHGR